MKTYSVPVWLTVEAEDAHGATLKVLDTVETILDGHPEVWSSYVGNETEVIEQVEL